MKFKDLNKTLEQALEIVKNFGEIKIDDKETIKIGNYILSKVFIGRQCISNDLTIVNEIKKNLNIHCSFLQIIPEGIVRISTTLQDNSGHSLNGTIIENTHPISISLRKGLIETGRSWIVNDFYHTMDIPLFPKEGTPILCFGIGQKETSGEREVILFNIGNFIYGINIMFISEVIKIPEQIRATNLNNKYISEVFSLKDEIIPIIDTHHLLNIDYIDTPPEQKKILIIQFASKKYGLKIDKVYGLARYDLNEMETFRIADMDFLSSEMINGVLPKIKSFNNVIILYADKLIQIIERNI